MTKSLTTYAKLLADISLSDLDGFVNLLKEAGALLQVESIITRAEKIINLRALSKTVTIYRAGELNSETKKELIKKIEIIIDQPIVKEVEDKSLLAGLKIELPSIIIDGSLLGRLKGLSVSLKS